MSIDNFLSTLAEEVLLLLEGIGGKHYILEVFLQSQFSTCC